MSTECSNTILNQTGQKVHLGLVPYCYIAVIVPSKIYPRKGLAVGQIAQKKWGNAGGSNRNWLAQVALSRGWTPDTCVNALFVAIEPSIRSRRRLFAKLELIELETETRHFSVEAGQELVFGTSV